jgi:DivIVA domain-containing protein
MDELGMVNRRFSLGARGYNQDEVDAYLAGIAERMSEADANPAREASRISIASFSVVTLGYSRSEVNRYLSELRETLERRAERRPAGVVAVADEPEVEVVEGAAEVEEPEPEPEAVEPELEESEPEPQAVEPVEEQGPEPAEQELDDPAEPEQPALPPEPDDVVPANGNGWASASYAARVTPAANGNAASPALAPDDAATDGEPALDQPMDDASLADVADNGDDLRQAVMAALHEIRAAMDALEALVAGETPAEQAAEPQVAEPDPVLGPEPAAVGAGGNGSEPAPSTPTARPEPLRYAPVGYSTEPRPGLLNLTRDIIRLARGGTATRR